MDRNVKVWLFSLTVFLVGAWFLLFMQGEKLDKQSKENQVLRTQVAKLHNEVMGIIGSVQ